MRKQPPPAPFSASAPRFTRRQALKAAGLGLAPWAVTEGCGPMPNRCAGGPTPPEEAASGAGLEPTGRALLAGVDHVVVVMMENRSFDHFLGGLCLDRDYAAAATLDGLSGDEANPDPTGSMVLTSCLAGSGSLNPLHDWTNARLTFNAGRNDGFVRANAGPNQAEVMSYLGRGHLPFTYALAAQSVVCDRWFSSVMGPTWPNRFYLHAGTSLGQRVNHPMGFDGAPTVWERMAEGCWSAKNYYAGGIPWYSAAFPVKSFSGNDAMVPEPADVFFRDAASGNLPNFSLIDPDFQLNDGHPPHDLALAEAFLSSVHRALVNGPGWARTLLVVVFDEHGGFFDHVPPPLVSDPYPAFRQLGFRVPAIVAGPMVRPGAVVSTPFDHVSIAATLRTRFGIASLGMRMDGSNDLASCIDPARAVVTETRAALLPTVNLGGGRARLERAHATSQPELERFARAGGVPAEHIDVRAPNERVRSWLRHAQELEAVRVIE